MPTFNTPLLGPISVYGNEVKRVEEEEEFEPMAGSQEAAAELGQEWAPEPELPEPDDEEPVEDNSGLSREELMAKAGFTPEPESTTSGSWQDQPDGTKVWVEEEQFAPDPMTPAAEEEVFQQTLQSAVPKEDIDILKHMEEQEAAERFDAMSPWDKLKHTKDAVVDSFTEAAEKTNAAREAALNDPGAVGQMARAEEYGNIEKDKARLNTEKAETSQRQAAEKAALAEEAVANRRKLIDGSMQKLNELEEKVMNNKLDSNRLWNKTTGWKKALANISIFVGGMYQHQTGGKNIALESINKAIETDIAEQKYNMSMDVQKLGMMRNNLTFKLGIEDQQVTHENAARVAQWAAVDKELAVKEAQLGESQAGMRAREMRVQVQQKIAEAKQKAVKDAIDMQFKAEEHAAKKMKTAHEIEGKMLDNQLKRRKLGLGRGRGRSSGGGSKYTGPVTAAPGKTGAQGKTRVIGTHSPYGIKYKPEQRRLAAHDIKARFPGRLAHLKHHEYFILPKKYGGVGEEDIWTKEDFDRNVGVRGGESGKLVTQAHKAIRAGDRMATSLGALKSLIDKEGMTLDTKVYKSDGARLIKQALEQVLHDYRLVAPGMGTMDTALVDSLSKLVAGGDLTNEASVKDVLETFSRTSRWMDKNIKSNIELTGAKNADKYNVFTDLNHFVSRKLTAGQKQQLGHKKKWELHSMGMSPAERAVGLDSGIGRIMRPPSRKAVSSLSAKHIMADVTKAFHGKNEGRKKAAATLMAQMVLRPNPGTSKYERWEKAFIESANRSGLLSGKSKPAISVPVLGGKHGGGHLTTNELNPELVFKHYAKSLDEYAKGVEAVRAKGDPITKDHEPSAVAAKLIRQKWFRELVDEYGKSPHAQAGLKRLRALAGE